MRYRLLGPLQVVRVLDGVEQPVDLGAPKQRAVLAVLLLARGQVVSTDRLIDAVWGDDVPASATASLHAYISNLRKVLRPAEGVAAAIVRRPPGYYLEGVCPATVDLEEFGERCAAARTGIENKRWREALEEASAAGSLWRGGLLEDLGDHRWVRDEAVRLDELRTECRENRVTALLALGRIAEALTEAAALRIDEPLRDRACWLLMLALYRAGRGPEALDTFTGHAAHLDAELGLLPGPELRGLQTAILRQSPELAAWPRSPAWTGAQEAPSPGSAPVSARSGAGGQTKGAPKSPLVGREREIAVLTALLADVRAGATRWLLLTGPPGIGKTRLGEEAADLAAATGARVVWVNCPDERGTPPWWPIRQLVRALGADADTTLQVPDDADPDAAKFLVYERVQALLQVDEPLAVVIDDAQWADSTSASCLAYVAGALRDHPVAVIVTVRDGERGPELGRLLGTVARGDRNRHIDVPALSPDDVAALANEVVEDPEDKLSAAEAAILAHRTGGNPFFVSEYARLPRQERSAGDIPSAIRSVLDRRLAVLDPAVLQVLRTAAVIGDTLDGPAFTLLAATTGLDLDTLADRLDEAADERILISAHDGTGYEFAHGLLREHLLAGMSALRLQRLHAAVADQLAGAGDPSRHAQHLIAALPLVEPVAVVDACRRAAEEAEAQWSSQIAAHWWQAGLDAYDLLPAAQRNDVERDGLTVALLQALARAGRGQTVLDTVATSLTEALRTGRAATAGRVAAALLRASGAWPWLAPGTDPGELNALLRRAAVLAEGDPCAGARVRAALAVGHCYDPDPSLAADELATADELAAATEDPDIIADALMGRLITYSGKSTVSRASLGWAEQLMVLPHSRNREDTVIAHAVAAMATMNLADVAATRRHVQLGIAGSEVLRLPVLRAQLRWMEAVLAIWHGHFLDAERHLDIAAHVHEQTELYEAGSGLVAAASLLRETGQSLDAATLRGMPGGGAENINIVAQTALLTVQRGPVAREGAIAVLNRPDRAAGLWIRVGFTTLLAHLCADHRLPQFAPRLLGRLADHRDELALIGQVGIVGPVALATARLHALLGDTTAARADVTRAARIAAEGGGVPSSLRCRLLSCELDAASGDVSGAALQLAEEADALGMRGVAAAARELTT